MNGLYKNHKLRYVCYIAFITIVTSCALGLSLGEPMVPGKNDASKVTDIILKIKNSFRNDATNDLFVLVLLGIALFFLARREYSERCKKCSLVFSICAGILLLLGRAFYRTNTLDSIFLSPFTFAKALIILAGYAILIYYFVNAFMEYLLPKLEISTFIKEYRPKKFKVTIGTCLIAILIAWLPYIIVCYPCNFTPDARDEVAQFLGNKTICKTYKSIVYPEESTTLLNNHHPIAYTVMVGAFAKAGILLGNINVAMFVLAMLQAVFLAFVYSYTIDYMKKLQVPIVFQLFALAFFMFYPVIPMYALTITKDSLYGGFLILVTIQLFKVIKSQEEFFLSGKEKWILFGSSLGLMLLRNNGLYVMLVVLLILGVRYRNNIKRLKSLAFSIGIPICLYWIVLLKIILPACNIPGGSPREMLSVPFQQVARYAVEWDADGFGDGELEKLNKILCFNGDLDELKQRYDPVLSDGIKNHFNKYYTSEELKDFFEVWAKLLVRHPGTFVTATLNNIYYYYSADYGKHILYNGTGRPGAKFGLRNPTWTNPWRTGIVKTVDALNKSSMLGWAFSVGTWNYMFLLCTLYVIYKRQYKYLLMTLPVLLNLIICIAGPVAYMRYAIEWIVVLPVFGAMVWCCMEEKKEIEIME